MVSSIGSVPGATILVPPRPGTGDLHETLTIVQLRDPARLSTLTRAIEDAATLHRPEILPGVRTVVTARLKADATPTAIMEALQNAGLVEE